jgi:hypothetical protein
MSWKSIVPDSRQDQGGVSEGILIVWQGEILVHSNRKSSGSPSDIRRQRFVIRATAKRLVDVVRGAFSANPLIVARECPASRPAGANASPTLVAEFSRLPCQGKLLDWQDREVFVHVPFTLS